LIHRIEQSAIKHRRSINDEVITILDEYLQLAHQIDTVKSQIEYLQEILKEIREGQTEYQELAKLGAEVKLQRLAEKNGYIKIKD
jgi:arginine decarboxylase-like protein